jgi:hypothetical protein
LPLGLESYRNTALFSDHFLSERLPEMPWYGRDGRVGRSRAAHAAIKEIFERIRPEETLVDAPEAQCEEDVIRPVLQVLGHEYLVQPSIPGASGTKNFPDYSLYASLGDRDAALRLASGGPAPEPIALAEGKAWDRDLDRKTADARDYLTNANPSYQVINYLTRSGLRWAILTNGRIWRLYCRDAPQPLDRYFEINLPRLVRESEAGAFLNYFWGVFSADALRPTSGGESHVDRIQAGSVEYATGVGTELRQRVFEALLRLAAGLVKGRKEPISELSLREIYDNSLVVLYRLLFVLYAEARELLPLESNRSYRETLSLTEIVRDIADKRERRIVFSSTATSMWDRLAALWRAIDEGDRDLGVAAYDGELFAAGAHSFLDSQKIADLYLADALELVGRVTRDGIPQFVDYRSLSVTHLGTVYEGLLENQLEIDQGKLGPPEDKIALAPLSGRRRETGSYYTPDPVVQFIVRETLSPLIKDKDEAEILALRIVDPAMGSGHFLVAAVEYLALAIATLPAHEGEGEGDDLASIKRRVVECCIWGVDINPLAVELSKLSLWLATASTDKPLSFLDNRLRCGNSVMTVRPDDVRAMLRKQRSGNQVTTFEDAFDRQHAADLDVAAELTVTDPDTMEGIERRKELFARQGHARARLRLICDLAVGQAFGLAGTEELNYLTAALSADDDTWEHARVATGDCLLPADYEPFHWELEFPDVFDSGGFHAVLGNPPYVSAWEMTESDDTLRAGLAALPRWKEVAKRHWDLFVLFVALSQQVLVEGGLFGIIVANPVMRERYAEALRKQLLTGSFIKVVDFDETNVFEGVARQTVVLVWQRTAPAHDHRIEIIDASEILAAV